MKTLEEDRDVCIISGERGGRNSDASIRVVSFLIERADPFYYSALLSSIMRLDTARYPLACLLACSRFLNTGLLHPPVDHFPISPSFRRGCVLSVSIANSHATYNRRGVQRRGQLPSFVSPERKPGQFDCYRKIEKMAHVVRTQRARTSRTRQASGEFNTCTSCEWPALFFFFLWKLTQSDDGN